VDSFYPLWSGGTKADKVNPLSANVPSVTSTAEEKPLRRDAARNRQRILDAARELFVERGYVAATIGAIAGRASVSPETVYATFKNKRSILSRLIDVSMAGDDAPVPILERSWVNEMREIVIP